MEQEGLIKCVRGGACLPESVISFSNFTGREIINSEWKREIARKTAGYIRKGRLHRLSFQRNRNHPAPGKEREKSNSCHGFQQTWKML